MLQHKIKIIISGGGTGGHIFPAIAIANALKRKIENADILFVGAKGRMEMQKVPAAGYPVKGLWISGFSRSFSPQNLLFPIKLIHSIMSARGIISRFNPDVVIGVGGYASGPTLKVAASKNIPTLIQEQNSFPGITNRLLAKNVSRICVAYDNMERFFPAEKIIKTGNPVRREVVNITGKKAEALEYFGISHDAVNVLVIGGSQGALSINKSISNILHIFNDNKLNLLWQTGKGFYPVAEKAIETSDRNKIKAIEFIDRMDLAYAYADIVISRAGAIAISELCVVGKPSIFIPLPTAAEDHQMKNARALAEKQAALLIEDSQADTKLATVLTELVQDKDKQEKLSRNIKKLAIIDADERIAEEILKLIDIGNVKF